MRRLPVYLLLDTSGSMRGEPIESVKVGLQSLISTLRRDPMALESVHVSFITFDRDVKVLTPLTPLEELVEAFVENRGSSVVVIDAAGRPVGRILADDVVDVLMPPDRERRRFSGLLS